MDARQRATKLEQRMRDGYERIDRAVQQGADVAAWESFWIDLLREYEATCDELTAARTPCTTPAAGAANAAHPAEPAPPQAQASPSSPRPYGGTSGDGSARREDGSAHG